MKYGFIILLIVSDAYAAGSSGGGSPMDLKYGFLNFFILFGFLFLKLKNPIRAMFAKKAESIGFLLETAEKSSKEANLKLEMYQKKIKDLDLEEKKIKTEGDIETRRYSDALVTDNREYVLRLEKEVTNKLLNEEKRMALKIRAELTDNIINAVKKQITNDAGNSDRVSEKLLAQVK